MGLIKVFLTAVSAILMTVGCATVPSNSTPADPAKTTQTALPAKLNLSLTPDRETWAGTTLTIHATLNVNQGLTLSPHDFQLNVGSATYAPDASSSIPASVGRGESQVILVYRLPGQVPAATLNLPDNHALSLIIPKPVSHKSKPASASARATSSTPTLPPAVVTFQSGPTSVLVPYGWKPAKLSGGDWSGMEWVNPNDPNEYEKVIFSACVGCIMNPTLFVQGVNQIDLTTSIPESDVVGSFIFNHGNSIGYEYYPPNGDPYIGNGVLTVNYVNSTPAGSTYVNIVAPVTDHTLATQILNSFTTQ